jgi:hypothetical protein
VELRLSLSEAKPPPGAAPALAALWWAAKEDWERAHRLVMDEGDKDCAWVHAHLHRIEGDLENASYWYRQAGKPAAHGRLQTEWDAIASALLSGP